MLHIANLPYELLFRLSFTLNKPDQILKLHRVSESLRARGLKTDRLQGLTARASKMVALG